MKCTGKFVAHAAAVLVLVTMFFAAGCDNSAKKEEKQEEKIYAIGFFMYNADTYISSVASAFESAIAGKARVEVHSAQNDQLNQNEQIDAMLARKLDVLVVNLVDIQAGGQIADKAKKAGVSVIFFNREPDLKSLANYGKICFVGTTHLEAGKMQGDIIKNIWDNHPEYDKNKDGKLQYIMIQANPYNSEALARSEHSVKQARKLGVSLEQIGDTLFCDWDEKQAFEAMQLALMTLKDRVELVIANNDSMALGAIAALAEIGFNTGESGSGYIPVIGVDATVQALEAIRKGVMSGTVKQDGKLMGETIATFALNAAVGNDFREGTALEWDESGMAIRLPYFMLEGDR